MLDAKEHGGHQLYEDRRRIAERGTHRPLSDAEVNEVARLDSEMEKLYGAAWTSSGGK